ncbi:sulfatase-like hydrolase/transferase [Schlesneria sp. DSM 10557]|uniref:sulfatase-like hydrolase/transferase n=1 Tax=Schlesneria sp. DSM 10557 TaxID=3044399 RepID=UPI0035A110C4
MARIEIKSVVTMKRAVDLCTLCAFGITQPLLTALAKQTIYLHDQQVEWREVAVLLLLLVIVLPLGFVLLDVVVRGLSIQIGCYGQNLIPILLLTVVVLSLLRPYLVYAQHFLMLPVGLFMPPLAMTAAWYFIAQYEKRPLLRSWISWMSVGIVVFPLSFAWNFEPYSVTRTTASKGVTAESPLPVVLIVFDEFSGRTLLNGDMQVDRHCFPQFARLADISTWYRNASTVSPRTDIAVPAILSGQYPVVDRSPLADEYPGNLFELIAGSKSFEMTVFEPISRLSPPSIRRDRPVSLTPNEKCTHLLVTLGAVYPRLIFTTDTPVVFPLIPRPWFGLPAIPVGQEGMSRDATTGQFHYGGGEYRGRQLEHFLRCLTPSALPGFRFLHVVLPHFPWTFLPSGDQYESELQSFDQPFGARGELGEFWDDDPITVARNEYRYRLQVGYVDRFIGQVLDRLEENHLLESCLLIVTADHGVSFRPGHSRRLPDAETLPDILSVPLFVKLPGQLQGAINDQNVESVDLMPTILQTVGITIPESVEGIPLSESRRQPRKSFFYKSDMTVCEPDLLVRKWPTKARSDTDPSGLDHLPLSATTHPEWHGLRVEQFRVDDETIAVTLRDLSDPNPTLQTADSQLLVSRLVSGLVRSGDLPAVPTDVVLAINGVIVDSGRTSWREFDQHEFQLFSPGTTASDTEDPNEMYIELYLVEESETGTRLIRLEEKD